MTHVTPFYHSHKILKLKDSITLKNCLFAHDYLNNKLPESFNNYFTLQCEISSISTRQSNKGSLRLSHINSEKYGRNSIKVQATQAWNNMINIFPNDLKTLSKNGLKGRIKQHFINSYEPQ